MEPIRLKSKGTFAIQAVTKQNACKYAPLLEGENNTKPKQNKKLFSQH